MPQGRVLFLKGSGDVLNDNHHGTLDFTSRVYVELKQEHFASRISNKQNLGTQKSEILQGDCLTIQVYDEKSNCCSLTLDDIGERFGFIYSSHLIFFHESDLRNYDTWSLDSTCRDDDSIAKQSCDGKSLTFSESSLQDKVEANAAPHSNDVSLKSEVTPSSTEVHEILGKQLLHQNLFIRYFLALTE